MVFGFFNMTILLRILPFLPDFSTSAFNYGRVDIEDSNEFSSPGR